MSYVPDPTNRGRSCYAALRSRRSKRGKAGAEQVVTKEIIGHLVDSASNDHQRFVRGQLQEDLVFPGYAEDDRVRIGRYAEAPGRTS